MARRKRSIHELQREAMKRVGAIGKNHKIEFGKTKYNFRGIEDAYNRIQPIFAELGITNSSRVIDSSIVQGQTKQGDVQFLCTVTMEYTFYGEDGSSITMGSVGQAYDTSDKGMPKAMSIAHKYALFQMLMIPFQELDPDETIPKRFASVFEVQFGEYQELKRTWWNLYRTMNDVSTMDGEDKVEAFAQFVEEQMTEADSEAVDVLRHSTWNKDLLSRCQQVVNEGMRSKTAQAGGE